MKTQVYDITLTGCLFAERKIENPIAYVRGVFRDPQKINILKTQGRMMMFRVTEFYDQEGYDFGPLIESLTYLPSVNIVWEMNFSTRTEEPEYVI